MPNKENNILKYNLGEKSMKIPFIIYGDFESILEEISTCSNDPKKSSTTKISKHTPSGFSYCYFLIYFFSYSYLLIVHLIKQKISSNIIETKIV